MSANTVQEVMIGLGEFEERVVYSSHKHPQVGYIQYQGEKQKVCIGFWGDSPVWRLVDDEQEYAYCAQKTMRIDDDPGLWDGADRKRR